MARSMSIEEAEQFLDSKPRWISLSSIGSDGFPHTVPLGYFRVSTSIYLGCRDNTQKVRNIERNPKVSLSLDSGTTMQDIKGVLLRGDASIIRDDDQRLALHQLAAKQRGTSEEDLPTSVSEGSVYIKVSDYTITSWCY
jgi:nitroimidazol reductase NimA-like FMN-containing flavoprotein (pyridoxamine 5'-phosphate oxidase superfamily)